MGLAIYYQTTARMSAVRKSAIEHRAEELSSGRVWTTCQPLTFTPWRSGRLRGKSRDDEVCASPSKLQSLFGEDSRADQRSMHCERDPSVPTPQLPPGRLADVVKFLCDLSVEFGVIWEIRLERFGDIVGAVRNGRCDEQLLETASRVEPLGELLELEPIPSPPFLGPTRLVDTLIDEWGCDLRTVHLQLLDAETAPSSTDPELISDDCPLPMTLQDDADDGPTILPFPRFKK